MCVYDRSESMTLRELRRKQSGLTLVELLVYVALFVVVLTIVAGFLMNSLTAERAVRGAADASAQGQLLAQSLQKGVRNATAIRVSQPPESPAAPKLHPAGMQLLTVESMTGSSGSPATRCQAWLYTPTRGGQIFVRTAVNGPVVVPNLASSFIDDASQPSGKRVVAPAGWAIYGEFVKPVGTLPFTATANGVSFDLELAIPGSDPITLRGAENSRQNLAGSSTCF